MWEQMTIIASVTFLCMISPGPDMIIVMRNTFQGGRTSGLRTSLGVLCGNLVHVSYCALGVGWLISNSIVAFNVLKYAGAAYLVYLGIRSLMAGSRSLAAARLAPADGSAHSSKGAFVQGFVNNILNPKGTMFYLGVFTLVIRPDTPLLHTTIFVVTMMSISTAFWLVFVHALNSAVTRRILNKGQDAINRIFGAVLIAVGLKVAVAER